VNCISVRGTLGEGPVIGSSLLLHTLTILTVNWHLCLDCICLVHCQELCCLVLVCPICRFEPSADERHSTLNIGMLSQLGVMCSLQHVILSCVCYTSDAVILSNFLVIVGSFM